MPASDTDFIQLPVSAVKNLAPRGLGILAAFVTLKEEASIEKVVALHGLSNFIVRSEVRKLEEKGYLSRRYVHKDGRLNGVAWTVNLTPNKSGTAA
ncbi:hypothetical protein ABT282_08315 [Streptomyces sp. NPDC000927]|uniref:hypothetical protein n=1 Tax=Streptomyces sp. NPDC000927 TaxID=3154371 RepID=UPI003330D69C